MRLLGLQNNVDWCAVINAAAARWRQDAPINGATGERRVNQVSGRQRVMGRNVSREGGRASHTGSDHQRPGTRGTGWVRQQGVAGCWPPSVCLPEHHHHTAPHRST